MKTAGRRNPNRWGYSAQRPTPWRGWSEQISFDHVGWVARKTPAAGDVFFLDFPLNRTFQNGPLEWSRQKLASILVTEATTGWCLVWRDSILGESAA